MEDNRGTRKGLIALLSRSPRLSCLSSYVTGEEALRGIPVEKPNVALVDINLPGMSGIECVAKLKALVPDLQVLMLTMYEEQDLIFDSLRVGASGYLLKKVQTEELVQAIEQVHAGGAPMSMQVARKVVDHFRRIQKPSSDVEKLTPREKEILTLLAKGCFYKEIGQKLGVSTSTVATHLRRIYEKLHVQSRTEATVKFFGRE